MSEDEETALVPRLRFPEFRDSGEWESNSIGNKVDLLSGYAFKSEEISQDVAGIPLMRGINITEGFVRHNQIIDRYFLGKVNGIEKYRLRINDLVIGMDGSKVGKNSALITEDNDGALLVQRVARLRADSIATITFIFHHINSSKFHSYVDRVNTSGGIPHISTQQIKDYKIWLPTDLKEQQKIADCLSSLDDLITSENKKLETLKSHKKGLMQKLFPAEGKTVPEWRFPEFRDSGEWEENNFKTFIKLYRGSSPRPIQNYLTKNNGVNWIKIGDTKKTDGFKIRSVEEQITSEGAQKSRFVTSG